MKYHIVTFGCQQNHSDSERIAASYESRGYKKAKSAEGADVVVINTCVIRQQAEDRVYGLVQNLIPLKEQKGLKIVVTGCLVGAAARDPSGVMQKRLHDRLPQVDEFLPLEEVGFDYPAVRTNTVHAWVPISNGCNNFCTFCIVPFSRGREVSRPFEDIISEVKNLADEGYTEITLLGQNVNSYGADLIIGPDNIQQIRDVGNKTYFGPKPDTKTTQKGYKLSDGRKLEPIYVKHLGRFRIPTLFPYLLEEVCQTKNIKKVSFLSSNPWDFSDELIEVIANNPNVDRLIHLPVQSGDDQVLRRMNRWYSREEYLDLISKIKAKIPDAQISTDIIVGFPGESDKAFKNTVNLSKEAGFVKAFIGKYSSRPGTAATRAFEDDIPHAEKTRRFQILDDLINKQPITPTFRH